MASKIFKKCMQNTTPISILLLFFLLLMPNAFSVSSLWESYGKFDANEQFQNPTFTGQFNTNANHTYSVTKDGAPFQPLVVDLNSDGIMDIIGHEKELIEIHNANTGFIFIFDYTNLGFNQSIQGDVDNGSDGTVNYITGLNNNKVYRILFNGTDFNTSYHTNGTFELRSGIKCKNDICYFAVNNSMITMFNYTTNDSISLVVSGGTDIFDVSYGERIPPAIIDYDNDGKDELIFICDVDNDKFEQICVFNAETLAFDTFFNFPNGYSNDPSGAFTYYAISGFLVSNIDNQGTLEICKTHYREATAAPENEQEDSFLTCYKANGDIADSVLVEEDLITTAQTIVYPPVLADIDGVGQKEICVWTNGDGTGGYTSSLKCYDTSSNNLDLQSDTGRFFDTTSAAGNPVQPKYTQFIQVCITNACPDLIHPTSADLNNDGYDDIIISNSIWFSDGISNFTHINLSETFDHNRQFMLQLQVPVDINSNGFLELVGQHTNVTTVSTPSVSNNPPVLASRTFGQNFISPVCLDTSIIFTSRECGIEPCHYTNDVGVDRERLVSNCGINITDINGTYSLSTPTLSCFYNITGTFTFDVYIQDEANSEDYSQFQSKSIFVINGTAGSNCNLLPSKSIRDGEDESVIAEDDQITTEAELKDTIEILTGQSQFMKNLMVIMFTIIFMFGVAKYTALTHPLSYAISIFTLWIGFALLGLLSWVIVMIYAIVCIGLAVALYINSGGDSGK